MTGKPPASLAMRLRRLPFRNGCGPIHIVSSLPMRLMHLVFASPCFSNRHGTRHLLLFLCPRTSLVSGVFLPPRATSDFHASVPAGEDAREGSSTSPSRFSPLRADRFFVCDALCVQKFTLIPSHELALALSARVCRRCDLHTKAAVCSQVNAMTYAHFEFRPRVKHESRHRESCLRESWACAPFLCESCSSHLAASHVSTSLLPATPSPTRQPPHELLLTCRGLGRDVKSHRPLIMTHCDCRASQRPPRIFPFRLAWRVGTKGLDARPRLCHRDPGRHLLALLRLHLRGKSAIPVH